jgi:hypothetical protein
VEVAQRVGAGFTDGVRFVALGSVRAAELVTAAIAAALGLSTSGGALITDLKSCLDTGTVPGRQRRRRVRASGSIT